MKSFPLIFIIPFSLALASCDSEEATEYDRIATLFSKEIGTNISSQQFWRTSVTLKVNVTTDRPLKLLLYSSEEGNTVLYDYKEVGSSGTVLMTAPQGQGNSLILGYVYKGKYITQDITLSGKVEEIITVKTTSSSNNAPTRHRAPSFSISGQSISSYSGNPAKYYQFSQTQLQDYYKMMEFSRTNTDAKELGLNCNYELISNGPFYITWVNGFEADQRSRILGYFYHSEDTWKDITYVDLSETHKWDYIDGLSKVQYQISINDAELGLVANTWYDANFDLSDIYGATECNNMDRVGDQAYNSQFIYNRFEKKITALRGISFKIDVPKGKRLGFYLRSDEESYPDQWELIRGKGVTPYTDNQDDFMGTCFCVEFMNVLGNGGGYHRSFIKGFKEVYWMGMEDLVHGGDHDCNDVIFGVVQDLDVKAPLPSIVEPELPESDEIVINKLDESVPFAWTIAYEDVNRNADFDFNDAVIQLMPDYAKEQCCVTVMAAGSGSRMYLHYDGPNGDENLGEIHELLGSSNSRDCINTQGAVASVPFVQVDCVPWPKEYSMEQDAKRFYIEIQRGTCDDCTDIITLPYEPGQLPQALLVAGEWQWPMEGVHINTAYSEFSKWAHDVTRTRFWEWYQTPEYSSTVVY